MICNLFVVAPIDFIFGMVSNGSSHGIDLVWG